MWKYCMSVGKMKYLNLKNVNIILRALPRIWVPFYSIAYYKELHTKNQTQTWNTHQTLNWYKIDCVIRGLHIDGLVQDCSNSCVLAIGLLQSCIKPSIWSLTHRYVKEPGGRFKNTYELLNLRALKISKLHKNHIFQCMGKIFCVEFQRVSYPYIERCGFY